MKLKTYLTILISVILTSLSPGILIAQLNQGGIPLSFSRSMVPDDQHLIMVTPPSKDLLQQTLAQPDVPYHFALNIPVDLGIGSSGNWETAPDGTRVWRLNVRSPGALALTLYFDLFRIPEGGKLFVYNPMRTRLLGAFTSLNNNNMSSFATALIQGDQLTLEYDTPDGLSLPELHISEIAYAYRGVPDYTSQKTGFGGSGKCEVNVNCSEGNNWQNQKRGVARLQIKRSNQQDVFCTGTLVNNTKNDGTPYLLTADHCGRYSSPLDMSQWIFYFDYESMDCPNPANEPLSKSMTGASLISHGGNGGSTGSDFFLVLLNSAIPDTFNAYYNGWNRDTASISPSGVGIHHPEGDIKKISTYTVPVQKALWIGDAVLSHWRVVWSATTNGHGTTEPGSSGSPLFDEQGCLIGTLTGGESKCDTASLNKPDYYGMFSYHWDKNGSDPGSTLKYWLDPVNSGVASLKGWALSVGEIKQTDLITIWPNPVTDQLNFRTNLTIGKTTRVLITDLWANQLMSSELFFSNYKEEHLNLAGFAKGMYLVRITDGEHQVVRKIIKE